MSPFRHHRRGLVSAAILSAAASLTLAACGGYGDNAGAAEIQDSSNQSSTQSNSQSSNQSNQSSTTSGGGSLSQSSFSSDEGTVRLFAGTSDATITVDVSNTSRLLWSNDKGSQFRLDGAGGAAVDSSGGSGELTISSGHHRLQVHGRVWTIVIRPQ